MNQNEKSTLPHQNRRRVFFGQLLAAVGGGLVGAGLLKKVFNVTAVRTHVEQPIDVTIHPLAVPRAKEGSKSHA